MNSNLYLTEVNSDIDRQEISVFLKNNIPSLKNYPKPVLMLKEHDERTEYLIISIRDIKKDNRIVGVAVAGSANLMSLVRFARSKGIIVDDYIKHNSKIRELEYLAIDKRYRGEKLGSMLVKAIEEKYRKLNYSVIIGNIDDEHNKKSLTNFYEKAGYQVGNDLPPFFNLQWGHKIHCDIAERLLSKGHDVRNAPPTAYFYKRL